MVHLSTANVEHMRDLLNTSDLPRDALPYTDEFRRLKDAFWDRTFKKMTNAQFWEAILNVAKKGGVRGKARTRDAPRLSEEQMRVLQDILPLPLGERDRLPYSERFEKMVSRFNAIMGSTLTPREVWLSILSIAK